MDTLSLSRLNEFIRRAIALNFAEPIWIVAEVVQAKENRGHFYIDLIEKNEEDEIIAQNVAVLWKNTLVNLQKNQPKKVKEQIEEGKEIRIQVLVDYHPRYGLKLIIQQVDFQFSAEKQAEQRARIIEKLISLNLWQQNKQLALPKIIQRVAVITSLTAAGKEDLEGQLQHNPYNYHFFIQYFPCAMQGKQTSVEVSDAIERINNSHAHSFDVIAIIRGGGSKIDLSDFDDFSISKSISLSKIPVVTGIGHTIDESIADLSANLAFRTPTAVADFMVQHNNTFETECMELYNTVHDQTQAIIHAERLQIQNIQYQIMSSVRNKVSALNQTLLVSKQDMMHALHSWVFQTKSAHNEFQFILQSNDPEAILMKGYSLTLHEQHVIQLSAVQPGDVIETQTKDGKLTSTIQKIWLKKS